MRLGAAVLRARKNFVKEKKIINMTTLCQEIPLQAENDISTQSVDSRARLVDRPALRRTKEL